MLLKIYLKEMKDSFRDRRTLLLTVFLPIIMMTGLVLFYEGMVSDGSEDVFQLAVDQSFGATEEMILTGFENIELVKSADPVITLEEGDAHAALILSEGFIGNVNNDMEANATIIGDSFSEKSSTLMALVTTALGNYESIIVSERLASQGIPVSIVQPFEIVQQEITDDSASLNLLAMLIPLIMAIAIGVGATPSSSDLFAGEKEKKTMEALLMTPVNRMTLLLAKWLTITSVGVITGIITLAVVALEITFLTENLKSAVTFGDNVYLVIGSAILVSVVYSMFIATLLMLTSIMGKTVKEAQSYGTPILMIAVFPLMITTGIGINELSFSHFAIPIMNVFTIMKELSFGIVNFQHLGIMVGSNLACILVAFIISRLMFLKDKWVIN